MRWWLTALAIVTVSIVLTAFASTVLAERSWPDGATDAERDRWMSCTDELVTTNPEVPACLLELTPSRG